MKHSRSGRASLQPDNVIVPVVCFDEAHHRLGYGCGFFDRALAIIQRKPLIIGVGYAQSGIAAIYLQSLDVPMDVTSRTDRATWAGRGNPTASLRRHRIPTLGLPQLKGVIQCRIPTAPCWITSHRS